MAHVFNDLSGIIGNTPLYRSKLLSTTYSEVLIKLEQFNPTKHVHDRVAKYVIDEAEISGKLRTGVTIIDATLNNYAISLAFYAGLKGYKVKIVLPENNNQELINMIESMGAKTIFSDPNLSFVGAYSLAEEIANKHADDHLMLSSIDTTANKSAHQHSTGPEIWSQTEGNVDAFVCAYQSGGVLSGVSKYLKEQKDQVKIVMVETASSAIYSGKRPKSHKFADMGPGFKPQLLDNVHIDEVIVVSDIQANTMQKRLATKEGLFISGAAAAQAHAAHRYANRNPNKCIVTMAHTYGERFIATITDAH